MLPTQSEFEELIIKLKNSKTESFEIEAKEDLPLSSDGDKAYFIHHIAALANNVVPSYLIIGIEDKSWNIKGLSSESLLMDADNTQNNMNQILEKRLDPQLAIYYSTYEYEGKTLGLISVEGPNTPYLIAISDDRYGGNRTKGNPFYIFRGAIYIRHGASSIIANRQSRIFQIIEKANRNNPDLNQNNQIEEFLKINEYLDVEGSDFGKNSLTKDILEYRSDTSNKSHFDPHQAQSWVSLLYLPSTDLCSIDTSNLRAKLLPDRRIGREGQWYHGLPWVVSSLLQYGSGNPKYFQGKSEYIEPHRSDIFTHVFRIQSNGVIHFAATYPLFYQNEHIRLFSFVNLIGYLWQLTFLVKAAYQDAGFQGNINVMINLIGTSGTYLLDPAKGWSSLGDWNFTLTTMDMCHVNNIQISREIKIPPENDKVIEVFIRSVALELGQYYNQKTPKCFTPDTNEFPVATFVQNNSRHI